MARVPILKNSKGYNPDSPAEQRSGVAHPTGGFGHPRKGAAIGGWSAPCITPTRSVCLPHRFVQRFPIIRVQGGG